MRNTEVRRSAMVHPIDAEVISRRLRWYGHVLRRPPEHVTRQVLNRELPGRRGRGRPTLTWDRVVRADMQERGLQPELAQDRRCWKQRTLKKFKYPFID